MKTAFNSILVSVTEACHVGCGHCGFIGSHRDRETDENELVHWVRQCCEYGIPVITFTGGEPFERLSTLAAGVRAASATGARTAVFTSSAWATSGDETARTLGEVRDLEHLYLSSDVYHQRRVPIENVYRVIEAADRLSIPQITICITYADEVDLRSVRSQFESYGDRVRFYEERVIPTPFIQRVLKGQDALSRLDPEAVPSSCWIDTPIINPNGDVLACHVGKAGAHGSLEESPYWLGNLRRSSFSEVVERASLRPEYQLLRTLGPRGVAEAVAASEEVLETVGRDEFSSRCDMCFSVLSTPEGADALRRYARRPDVMFRVNAILALQRGEAPLERAAVGVEA